MPFLDLGLLIRTKRHRMQQGGQSIQVPQCLGVHPLLRIESDHSPLCPSDHGAGVVEVGSGLRSPREDESLLGIEIDLQARNPLFEFLDTFVPQRRCETAGLPRGHRQFRAHCEQVVLNPIQ